MTPAQQRYRSYLNTPAWFDIRRAEMEAAGYTCRNWWCKRAAVEVHHKRYRRWGDEQPQDVRALCRRCHRLAHRRWLAAAWWWVVDRK